MRVRQKVILPLHICCHAHVVINKQWAICKIARSSSALDTHNCRQQFRHTAAAAAAVPASVVLAAGLPAAGTANPLVPVTAQQYKQAQDQWSEAYLRFKTGAAATEPEVLRNNRTFFPVFGDKPDQIAQKALAREQAERDIGIAAGRGAGLGAQPTAPIAKTESKPSAMPSQSAIDAELKRRGLK